MKLLLKKKYYWRDKPSEDKDSSFNDLEEFLNHWKEFKEERKSLIDSGRVTSVVVHLITPNKAVPRPEGLKNGDWCPYCGSLSSFVPHSFDTCKVCEACGISDKDFYVRKYNWRQ